MHFHVLLLRGFVSSSWLSLPLPDLFLQSVKEHPFRNTWFIFILQSSTLCPLMSLCFLFRSLKSLRGIIEQRWAKYSKVLFLELCCGSVHLFITFRPIPTSSLIFTTASSLTKRSWHHGFLDGFSDCGRRKWRNQKALLEDLNAFADVWRCPVECWETDGSKRSRLLLLPLPQRSAKRMR